MNPQLPASTASPACLCLDSTQVAGVGLVAQAGDVQVASDHAYSRLQRERERSGDLANIPAALRTAVRPETLSTLHEGMRSRDCYNLW